MLLDWVVPSVSSQVSVGLYAGLLWKIFFVQWKDALFALSVADELKCFHVLVVGVVAWRAAHLIASVQWRCLLIGKRSILWSRLGRL